MTEPAKKILAYQQTPLVLTCQQSGEMPEDFLVSLTDEEREYVSARGTSPVEPIFYELLSRVGAAGLLSSAPPVLLDVHTLKPRVFTNVDGIIVPLAEEQTTHKWLLDHYVEPYQQELTRLVNKTKQRFGEGHVVHLSVLPRFVDGKAVEEEIVTFGEPILEQAAHEPEQFRELYDKLLISKYTPHTWIGINPKLFSTHTLRQELLERLSRMKIGVVAHP